MKHVSVLVVDDDSYRKLVQRWVASMGHQCQIGESGTIALQHLQRSRFDLVLTDMIMPDIDGLQLLQHLRENHVDISGIVLSGFAKAYSFTDVSSRKLKKLGYRINATTSSIEALEAFKVQPEIFDLVITDLAMPNMTGLDMAVEMIRVRPDIPVILATGFVDSRTVQHARDIGV